MRLRGVLRMRLGVEGWRPIWAFSTLGASGSTSLGGDLGWVVSMGQGGMGVILYKCGAFVLFAHLASPKCKRLLALKTGS
jgi:hypothetical protein